MESKAMAFLIRPSHPNPTAPHSHKAERVCYTSDNGWPSLAVLVITVLTKVYSLHQDALLGVDILWAIAMLYENNSPAQMSSTSHPSQLHNLWEPLKNNFLA